MKQPPSYVHPQYPHYECCLRKALYGLKQALCASYQRFAAYISSLGFTSSHSDSSLFTFYSDTETIYLILYVNDMILTTSDTSLITGVISHHSSEFSMIDLGPLSFFLGIDATRFTDSLFLS